MFGASNSLNAIRVWSILPTALLMLVACTSLPQYSPKTSETARLRIAIVKGGMPKSPAGDSLFAEVFDYGTCENGKALASVYTMAGTGKRQKAGRLNMPLGEYKGNEVFETHIDANTDINLILRFVVWQGNLVVASASKCAIAMDVQFDPNKDYEIVGVFDMIGNCTATLNELVSSGGSAQRREIATYSQRSNPAPDACIIA